MLNQVVIVGKLKYPPGEDDSSITILVDTPLQTIHIYVEIDMLDRSAFEQAVAGDLIGIKGHIDNKGRVVADKMSLLKVPS